MLLVKNWLQNQSCAINPLNPNQKVPVYFANLYLWITDLAVFGCPAHDQRDFDFAKKYGLKIKTVVKPFDKEDDFEVENEAMLVLEL